jgi:hypothetical protein
MPRHDLLHRLATEARQGDLPVLLVAPTWRMDLVSAAPPGSSSRVLAERFWDSGYARTWFGLLRDDALRDVAIKHDLQIVFAVHPGFGGCLEQGDVPEHVRLVSHDSPDLLRTVAEARLVVTDYASIAFDVVFCGSPVICYRPHGDDLTSDRYPFRRGQFGYGLEGLGATTRTVEETIEQVERLADPKAGPDPQLRSRILAAFPLRDDQSCARVVAAIQDLVRAEPADVRPPVVERRLLDPPGRGSQ